MVEQKKTSAALNTADRGATLELLSTTTKVEEVNTHRRPIFKPHYSLNFLCPPT